MREGKDYSSVYMPIWKRQTILILILIIGTIASFLILKNRSLSVIFFGLTIATGIINFLILACPACGCKICLNTRMRGVSGYTVMPFDKICPKCGAVLRR